MKKFSIITFAVLFIFTTETVWSIEPIVQESDELLISLDVHKQPLIKVVEDISKQTGYSIIINEKWSQVEVFGMFKESSVDSFFRRVLRGENISISFDPDKKVILVRSFGEKGKSEKLIAVGSNHPLNPDSIDPTIGLTQSEIKALQENERKQFLEWSNNPESVDPIIGKTLGEIESLNEHERTQFLESSNNPDTVDPTVGKTLGEIRDIQDQQRQAFMKYNENPESIDTTIGKPLGEIKAIQDQERQVFMRYSENPDSFDPIMGMTLGELKALNQQQREIFLSK